MGRLPPPSLSGSRGTAARTLSERRVPVDVVELRIPPGKLRLEGKDYVMHDGDVVEFRFAL